MSKLIFRSDGYEIELDISSAMRRAIHDKNPRELDKVIEEFKHLIISNTSALSPRFKIRLPWFN